MLTAELVHVRRRGDALTVVPLSEGERERARALGAAYLDLARAHVGQPRGAFLEACRAVTVTAREQRLARGLLKLVTDRCVFEEGATVDPAELRRDLFLRASAARRHPGDPATRAGFDREALMAAVAAERQRSVAELERALYADLPDAHLLQSFAAVAPEALVAIYENAQVQAVLLRAVKVTATVRSATPASYRHLFRRLKFLRLLYRIEPCDEKRDGYRLEIDGPFSLFESVTRYGLQLALAFPAIAACDRWSLEAELRWGREARPLRFQVRGQAAGLADQEEPRLPDEVAALLEQLRAARSTWRPRISSALFDLPGVGLCVPDLELRHDDTGETVYLEVLGFWSRDAVWKRVELAERGGLPRPVVFAVSKHLRVSEQALDGSAAAALYVYSRAMNASAVLERVEQAARRARVKRGADAGSLSSR